MARRLGVILTRPAGDTAEWLAGLLAHGHPVQAWPLIEVRACADTSHLQTALARWSQFQAVMFVSRSAVLHAFAAGTPDWGNTRCWATGPGTRQALLAVGVPDALIDSPSPQAAQFDTEALWREVGRQVSGHHAVLVLRGSDADKPDSSADGVGRDWLVQQLKAHGSAVQTLAVYERHVPTWDAERLQQAQAAASDGRVWLFSSSQSLVHLQQLMPKQDWRQARTLATHPRIGAAAQAMGWGDVRVCKPSLPNVLSSLESFA
ncbi:MAG: uroporphyrinogen-III synthase [Betaproteobacteria bacterium]|nr:uroporphyrinogen-III synthase [Betaproteobacteria bacterium]